jgi:AraC family transcriptional regulator
MTSKAETMHASADPVADTRRRVLLASDYLRTHLDEKMDLHVLAGVAGFSPYHFHRIFHAVIGETVGQHLRRLRLERAAESLRTGRRPITAIALDAGYESHAAFTKAFRQSYGISPSEWRQAGPMRTAKAAMLAITQTGVYQPHNGGTPGGKERTMFQEIRMLAPRRIVFVEHPFAGSDGQAGPRTAWGAISRYVDAHDLRGRVAMGIGAVMDDLNTVPHDRVRYRACYFVNDDAPLPADEPGGAQEGQSEVGKHAVFLYEGPYAGMGDAWGRVFGEAFPATGLSFRPAPIFEIYLNADADVADNQRRTELFVPVA